MSYHKGTLDTIKLIQRLYIQLEKKQQLHRLVGFLSEMETKAKRLFNNKEKERADKLEGQLQDLLEREQIRNEKAAEEQREIDAAIEEANKLEKLVQEAKELKEAEKTLATEKGEPWINVVSMDMEPGNTANIGAIEMDWNENFIKMLHQNGYNGVSDEDAVDQWFRDVCKHVVLETYEDASEEQKITRTGLDDGRAEYS